MTANIYEFPDFQTRQKLEIHNALLDGAITELYRAGAPDWMICEMRSYCATLAELLCGTGPDQLYCTLVQEISRLKIESMLGRI